MKCPNDNTELEQMLFHQVEVDYCPHCLGMWFDNGELVLAKNDKDPQLNWMDFELWQEITSILNRLPEIDFGIKNGFGQKINFSHHVLPRAFAAVYNIRFFDGTCHTFFSHSLLQTNYDNIIDLCPPRTLGEPLLILGELISVIKSSSDYFNRSSIHQGRFETPEFQNLIIRAIDLIKETRRLIDEEKKELIS